MRKVLGILVLAAVVIAVVIARLRGGSILGGGVRLLERWCERQLQAIADDNLHADLSFGRLEYIAPDTVVLHDVRLQDEDVVVLEMSALRIGLGELPKSGQPLVIGTVELDEPVIRLVPRADGGLVGLSDPVDEGGGRDRDDGGSTKPSEVFAIRAVRVQNGALEWTGSQGDTMHLDALSFELQCQPEQTPGLYRIDVDLDRPPVLDLGLLGAFDIDESILQVDNFMLASTIREDELDVLPPPIQAFCRQRELRGNLNIRATGTVPLQDAAQAQFRADVILLDGHAVLGRYALPVGKLDAHAELSSRKLTIDPFEAEVFDGTLSAQAALDLAPGHAGSLWVHGTDLRLERAIRPDGDESTDDISGAVTVVGSANGSVDVLPDTLAGDGTLEIKDARLMGDRLFGGLMRAAGRKAGGRDRGSSKFTLTPDNVEFRSIELIGGTTAARGEGELGFDGALDFRFNAGPLERVQAAVPLVGDMFAKVTDRIVTYHVTGTTADPQFTVRPLGIGVANPDRP
jgi:hypothetical protein